MSVALRWAISSARRCFRSAASAFFWAFSAARASRSAWTAASPATAALVLDGGERRLDFVHPGADVVDLVQLLGGEEAVGHHRAVDQLRARVVGGRDQVAAAEPGVGEQVPPLARRLLDLLPGDRQVRAGVEARAKPRTLRHRGRSEPASPWEAGLGLRLAMRPGRPCAWRLGCGRSRSAWGGSPRRSRRRRWKRFMIAARSV